MARCNFSIAFMQTPESLAIKARQAIQQAGGSFNGDGTAGTFSLSTPIGSVDGSYTIENSFLKVQIDHKPVFLSCTRIQAELLGYLSEK